MLIPAGPCDDDQRHFLGWWPLRTCLFEQPAYLTTGHIYFIIWQIRKISFSPTLNSLSIHKESFTFFRVWVYRTLKKKGNIFVLQYFSPCIIDLSTENRLAAALKSRLKLQKFTIKSTDNPFTFAMLLIPSLKWIIYMLITANLSF